jgi:hypothetical protein
MGLATEMITPATSFSFHTDDWSVEVIALDYKKIGKETKQDDNVILKSI